MCRGNREMARVLLLTKPSGRFFPLTKMASCKGKAYKRDRVKRSVGEEGNGVVGLVFLEGNK